MDAINGRPFRGEAYLFYIPSEVNKRKYRSVGAGRLFPIARTEPDVSLFKYFPNPKIFLAHYNKTPVPSSDQTVGLF